MITATSVQLDPRTESGVRELAALIDRQYPGTTFWTTAGEDPGEVFLWAGVEVDDPDVVMDVVIDRQLDFLIEEGLPITVIPTRCSGRDAAHADSLAKQQSEGDD